MENPRSAPDQSKGSTTGHAPLPLLLKNESRKNNNLWLLKAVAQVTLILASPVWIRYCIGSA